MERLVLRREGTIAPRRGRLARPNAADGLLILLLAAPSPYSVHTQHTCEPPRHMSFPCNTPRGRSVSSLPIWKLGSVRPTGVDGRIWTFQSSSYVPKYLGRLDIWKVQYHHQSKPISSRAHDLAAVVPRVPHWQRLVALRDGSNLE